MNAQSPKIYTKNLVLRAFAAIDRKPLLRLLNDEHISSMMGGFIPYPYTLEDATTYIEKHKNDSLHTPSIAFAIILKETNELIGNVQIRINNDNKSEGRLSYWIGKTYWGKGYATETVQSFLSFLFNNSSIEQITADHFIENPASGKVLEKCGFAKLPPKEDCSNSIFYLLLKKKDCYTIREALIDDAFQISKVHIDSWKVTYENLLPDAILQTLSYDNSRNLWTKILTSPLTNANVYVAQFNKKIVGFCSVEALQAKGYIHALYILPKYQRLRIGSRLLLEAVDFFTAMNCQSIELGVLPGNSSMGFYQKLGGEDAEMKPLYISDYKTEEQIIRWKSLKALKSALNELIVDQQGLKNSLSNSACCPFL